MYFLCPSPGIGLFPQEALIPISGEWHLETKIWGLRLLIASGVSANRAKNQDINRNFSGQN